MTKLQVVLDFVSPLDEAVVLVDRVKQSIDIIEIGTSYIVGTWHFNYW